MAEGELNPGERFSWSDVQHTAEERCGSMSAVEAPPPWTLHGEAHVLVLWQPARGKSELGRRVFVRHGGLGVLAFVRYTDSNVGPYDELLWLVPWGLQLGSQRFHTVPRIFVSTEASRTNGRQNWGIPKELARFDVQPLSASTRRVHVTTEAGCAARFVVESGRHTLRVSSRVLPRWLRQLAHVSRGQLFELAPGVSGRASVAHFSELDTNPAGFVDCGHARALGAFSLTDVELLFPVPRLTPLRGA
jgi:hypothetical protein